MPETKPLFDTAFQKIQRARRGRAAREASPLYREVQSRLDERLADLREKPPGLALSCLELQSKNDIEGALRHSYEDLPPGGLFLGVMTGGETLRELRLCLAETEGKLCGGACPRVAPMMDLLTLSRLLPAIGFMLPVVDSERIMLTFPDIFALMRALRQTGEANALSVRSRRPPPHGLFEIANQIYLKRFPSPDGAGIAATVDLLFLHGWK